MRLAVQTLLLSLLLAACDFGSPYNEKPTQLPSSYFRMTATYKVLKTDEIIEFDYVAACGGTVTNWRYTSSSVWVTVSPGIMIMPTASGQSIGVRTPDLCSARYKRNDPRYPIPDDFLPHTIWYPDIEDMGFGFAYASDLAYESPYSRLEFLGANLELSDRQAWLAWREKAAGEYEQLGGLPGPWGYSGQYEPREVASAVSKLNGGHGIAYDHCSSVARLNLPDEVRTAALDFIPEDAGRYWSPSYWLDREEYIELSKVLENNGAPIYNGGSYYQHIHGASQGGRGGVRRSRGKLLGDLGYGSTWTEGGALNTPGGNTNYYHDLFPVLESQPVEIDPETGDTNKFETIVLHEPEWNGFQFCGRGAIDRDDLHNYASSQSDELPIDYTFAASLSWRLADRNPEYTGWRARLMVNEDEALRSDSNRNIGHMNTILDREGYVFPSCCGESLGGY